MYLYHEIDVIYYWIYYHIIFATLGWPGVLIFGLEVQAVGRTHLALQKSEISPGML